MVRSHGKASGGRIIKGLLGSGPAQTTALGMEIGNSTGPT